MDYDEKDLPLIETLRKEDSYFSKLEEEHTKLKRLTMEMEDKYLSDDEEIRLKEFKKRKLAVKDLLNSIIKVRRSG